MERDRGSSFVPAGEVADSGIGYAEFGTGIVEDREDCTIDTFHLDDLQVGSGRAMEERYWTPLTPSLNHAGTLLRGHHSCSYHRWTEQRYYIDSSRLQSRHQNRRRYQLDFSRPRSSNHCSLLRGDLPSPKVEPQA